MPRQVVVVTTSLREGSNSDALADAFAAGALSAGHHVEKISLKGKELLFCQGCLCCQTTQACVLKDDAASIIDKLCHADVVAFATPIYYYEMSGQMKTLLDRCNPLFSSDYAFRDVFLLATAAEEGDFAFEKAVTGLSGWIDCFERASFAGSAFAGGVTGPGEIEGHPVLQQAFELGAAIK